MPAGWDILPVKGESALRKNIQTLDEVQEIDLRLDGIEGVRNALLAEMDALDQTVVAARQDILAKEGEIAALDEERQGTELTLAAEADNIVRSESRLKEIKTQKEYVAVSKEIGVAKKMKAELEEQLLQKIGQLDELKGSVAESQANLASLEENISARKAEVQTKVDDLDRELAEDRIAREEKTKTIPPNILKRYALLREMRRGLAVAEARDGSCLGCNMNLPPQLYNSLHRGEELILCPHCQRMLVLRQQS
jgi:hypothetical protein